MENTIEHVGFPGLGLEFTFNRIAFKIGSIEVRWYGIILCIGIIAAFFYFLNRATKTEGINEDHIYNVTLFTVIIAIIGARFTYVITNLDRYKTFGEMINITEGGIAIYGAIIFGGITAITYCKVKKLNTLPLLDSLAPAVMLGQIIGRWGNFVNGEAYGWSKGVENLTWRMTVDKVEFDGVYRPDIEFVHPTFLYESLWNLLGFILINLAYRKKKFDGQIFVYYIGWYGLGRAFIEMLRTDSLRVAGLKLSVIIGFFSVIAAVILYFIFRGKAKAELENAVSYESKYSALKVESDHPILGTDALSTQPFDVDSDENDEDKETEVADEDSTEDEEVLEEQDMIDGDTEESGDASSDENQQD